MLEFFDNEKYFKIVYKLKCIELENVLDFNEKKIDFLNNTKHYLLLFNND